MKKYKSVFFFCLPQGKGIAPAYQFQSIALAEGFKKLSISIYSNINYWKTNFYSDEYLFNFNPNIKPWDCDIVIIPHQWYTYGKDLPLEELRNAKNSKKILIDIGDGLFSPAFNEDARIFDLILKQKTKGIEYPKNCRFPWIFGLTEELIEITNNPPSFKERKKTIAVNFRNNHSVRNLAKLNFVDKINDILEPDGTFENFDFSQYDLEKVRPQNYHDLFSIQSGGRHNIYYITRMKNSMACAAFGGVFMLGNNKENNEFYHSLANYFISGRSGGKITKVLKKLSLQISHTYNLFQWDSWRFWESLACGCVTFHLDFDKYGIILPIMPINWVHYIGIDLLNPQESIKRIKSMSIEDLEKIGMNGREWALTNYSPEAVAKLFLSYL